MTWAYLSKGVLTLNDFRVFEDYGYSIMEIAGADVHAVIWKGDRTNVIGRASINASYAAGVLRDMIKSIAKARAEMEAGLRPVQLRLMLDL